MNHNDQERFDLVGTFFDNAPTAMGIYDYRKGVLSVVHLNAMYYQMLDDLKENRMSYRSSPLSAIYESDRAVFIHALEEAVEKDAIAETQIRLLMGDGSWKWFGMRARHEKLDEHTERFYAVYFDISQLLEAKHKAESEEKILHDAMVHADMLYFAYYPDEKRYENLMVPKSLDRVTSGMDDYPECVIRMCALNEEDAEKYREMVRKIDNGEEEAECIVRMRYQGSYQWMRVRLFNLSVEGKRQAAGFASSVDDVMRARQRLEDEMRGAKMLTRDLLGSVYVNVTQDTMDVTASRNEEDISYHKPYSDWILEEALSADPRIADQREESRAVLFAAAEDIIDEEKRTEYLQRINHFGLLDAFERGEKGFTLEYRRKVGSEIRWVSTETVFLENPDSADVYAFFYLRDIHPEKMKERINVLSLEKNCDFTGYYIPSKHQVVLTGIFGDCRGSYELNVPVEASLLMKDMQDRMEPAEYENLISSIDQEEIRRALKNGEDYTIVYDLKEKGELRRKKLTLCRMYEMQEETAIIQSDVTDAYEKEQEQMTQLSEALEAAESANQAKSDFLSRMSHDIRTPMNAIIGFSTLMVKDASDEEKVQDSAKKILSSGRHLLGLINDVLDMSKIESGKMQISSHEFSLSETIASIESMMRPLTSEKDQNFEIYVSGLAHDIVHGDENRIQQILINMLSNAVKYTGEGGDISLRISSQPERSRKYDDVTFTIEDNGRGMSEEYQKTLFDPFTREKENKENRTQGTGLGLAITKNLVTMMSGTISVESEQGVGTKFTVVIPLRILEKDHDPQFWKENHVLKMLAVDDDTEVLENIREIMEESGIEMEIAHTGSEAVEKVTQHRDYDIVLLDWLMPDLDGVQTARRIRHLLPEEDMIIILTAYDYSAVEEEAKENGVDAFMMKPFFVSSLQDTVRKVRGIEEEEESTVCAYDPSLNIDNCLKDLNILAAEDNDLNAEILVQVLKMNGAEVTVVPDGREVCDAFRNSKVKEYDLILMDVQMPVMDGYEASSYIRSLKNDVSVSKEKRKESEEIPIIAMTANAFSEDVQNALNAGMNGHVAKPLNLEVMKKTIFDILCERRGCSL